MAPPGSIPRDPVEDFMRDRRKHAHRSNLQRARTLVNNAWSRREEEKLESSRMKNPKRQQMEADKFEEVKRENIRLLLRMQKIDSGQAPSLVPQRSASTPAVARGSNSSVRMQELKRIDSDNQRMIQRLRSAKPSVNMIKLDEEHKQQQYLMKMRCEHEFGADALPRMRKVVSVGLGGLKRSASTPQVDVRLPSLSPACRPNVSTGMLAGQGQPADPQNVSEVHVLREPTSSADEVNANAAVTEVSACGSRENSPENSSRHGDSFLMIPLASRLLTQKLLEEDDRERANDAAMKAAREEADKAFRDATAVETDVSGPGGDDFMEYDKLVKRYGEAQGRRGAAEFNAAAAARARAAVEAAAAY